MSDRNRVCFDAEKGHVMVWHESEGVAWSLALDLDAARRLAGALTQAIVRLENAKAKGLTGSERTR